jgi:hypothetical protein
MEDVPVVLQVAVSACSDGRCGRKVLTKQVLMWDTMLPVVGDIVETQTQPVSMRLRVIGRLWALRHPTLICKPVKSFSVQNLIDVGFEE